MSEKDLEKQELEAEPSAEAQAGEAAAPTESLADNVRIISPMKLVLKRFFRSKLSIVGLVMFLVILLFSFLGPVFVSWGETEVDRTGGSTIYTFLELTATDENGNEYKFYAIGETEQSINIHATAMTSITDENGNTRTHVLGTDENGRDIFVRLMYGGRLSLILSFLVVIIYTLLGVILGGLAGYFGKWVDMLIMRIADILNCVPSLPILLIVGAILDGIGIDQSLRIYYLMGFLTLLSWTGIARLVRGQILFLREQEYIVATEALGFSPARKIFKHLVPNVLPQLIVSMTLGLGSTILFEASLSYLGLGVSLDQASWGKMVSTATSNLDILTYYVADWLPAGIMIIVSVLAFNFIGDGLRDALDPRMKR